jgi:hypothetical protein
MRTDTSPRRNNPKQHSAITRVGRSALGEVAVVRVSTRKLFRNYFSSCLNIQFIQSYLMVISVKTLELSHNFEI